MLQNATEEECLKAHQRTHQSQFSSLIIYLFYPLEEIEHLGLQSSDFDNGIYGYKTERSPSLSRYKLIKLSAKSKACSLILVCYNRLAPCIMNLPRPVSCLEQYETNII